MKTKLLMFLIIVLFSQAQAGENTKMQFTQPISFIENKGQFKNSDGGNEAVLFKAIGKGMDVFVMTNGLRYNFNTFKMDYLTGQIKSQSYVLEMQLLNTGKDLTVSKEQSVNSSSNFYLSTCPAGILNVHEYQKVTIKNIYPNIDWVLYSDGENEYGFEYDFIVHPGGNPNDIQIRYIGEDQIRLDNGELKISTPLGYIKESNLHSYQLNETNGISSSMILTGSIVQFAVANYDLKKDLTIDPTVVWATYYGGSAQEWNDSSRMTYVDQFGNIYITGTTGSTTNIGGGGYQNSAPGGGDAFLVKFDPSGNRLWGTYYGSTGSDFAYGVCADALGNSYITGGTNSTSGIAASGFQNTYGGGVYDAFIVKFDANGNRLWASYRGGSGSDYAFGTICDSNNDVYFHGLCTSGSGIASSGHQMSMAGVQDAFLIKCTSSGGLLWGTYYGGTSYEWSFGIGTDNSNNVYLAGGTQSSGNIGSGGFQNTYAGSTDGFLVKFNSSGVRQWGTYYGGSAASESLFTVATTTTGNVYVVGNGGSPGLAFNGFQNTPGGNGDGLIIKFNSSGARIWASYFGGSGGDNGVDLTLDANENIYFCGTTASTSGIAYNGHQNTHGGGTNDAYYAKFDKNGNRIFSSYLGGPGDEEGKGCRVFGNYLYVGGYTTSASNISNAGFQNSYGGSGDAMLTKLNIAVPSPSFSISSPSVCPGTCVTFSDLSTNTPATWNWNFAGSSVSTSTLQNPTNVCYSTPGTYSVMLKVSNSNGSDSLVSYITVYPSPTVSISGTNTICNGSSIALTANGANAYTWNTTATTSSISVSPSFNTTYTVTGTDANGCQNTATKTITVNPLPSISISGPSAICTGATASLNASGANTYTWNTAQTATSITVSPVATTMYSLTGTDANGCQNSVSHSVTVNPLPSVSANSSANAICSGGSVTLSGSGASTYTWTGGVSNGVSFSPSSTATYTVTGTDANGCQNSASKTVTVNPLPSVSIGGANTMCSGNPVVLIAAGANTYTWNTTATSTSISVNPTVNTTYSVIGTDVNGCQNSASHAVTVNALPSVTANSSASAVCQGSSVTLSGNGASTYTWTGGVTDGVAFIPSSTASYTVTGTDANGCQNSATKTITVNALPSVSVSGPGSICSGSSAVLSGNGASTYTWNTSATASTISVSPSSTASYTVTGTDANGCQNSATKTVTVNPLPGVTIVTSNSVICTLPVQQSATLTATGALTYTWNTSANTTAIVVSPSVTTSYTVTGTDVNGCSNSAVMTQSVSTCAGIAEATAGKSTFVIYPNPSNGTFTIESGEDAVYIISNELGQEIRTIELKGVNNTSTVTLPQGVYFISGKAAKYKVIVLE